MLTLADLIKTRKGERTYDELAAETGIPSSTLNGFALGQNRTMPHPAMVSKLALALRTTEREVVLSAAYGLGNDVEDTNDGPAIARLLPTELDDLPQRQQQTLIDVAEGMVALAFGDVEGQDITPEGVAERAAQRRDAAITELAETRAKRGNR